MKITERFIYFSMIITSVYDNSIKVYTYISVGSIVIPGDNSIWMSFSSRKDENRLNPVMQMALFQQDGDVVCHDISIHEKF